VRIGEAPHEHAVSTFISAMTVLYVEVPDPPGPDSARASIEQNAIALLSNRRRPIDPPSAAWLARHSPRVEIVQSGLWNLNHVDRRYDPAFLGVLEQHVERQDGSA
jgi:hypothetical protein